MKKPSRVIFMALCKTYGCGENRSSFMCNAIDHLENINYSEAKEAKAAVNEFVYSYDPYVRTLWQALENRGILEKNIGRKARMKVTRRLYIKLAIKLFFKGL